MNAEHCKAYTLLQEQQIDDIHAHGYLLSLIHISEPTRRS